MRHLELDAVIHDATADAVYDGITRFDRYAEFAPHVRSAEVLIAWPEPVGESHWELNFRSGLLRWTEREQFARERLEIAFAQVDGDFESFSGLWTLRQDGGDVRLHFEADFDFGIPSMEGILDPIAERVIKETVAWTVVGLFPGALVADPADQPDPAAAAAITAGA
ncbi:type II toxin-antitoxin system RatA family toxin [Microbispora sp. NPDC049125]|uniref:type II toxin-antitoxin system RatA family toxin n=1 Tax=Microbispora sp. NPDC049125 TaxID=3154929 RepID=UPI00346636A1